MRPHDFFHVIHRGVLRQGNINRLRMRFQYGHPGAGRRNRKTRRSDFAIDNRPQNLLGFFFDFFFFFGNVRHHIVQNIQTNHAGRTPRAAHGLHGSHNHLHHAESVVQGFEGHRQAGSRAIGHGGHKPFPPAVFLLNRDQLVMVFIYAGNKNGNVFFVAERRSRGNHWSRFGVTGFQVFRRVAFDRRENEINFGRVQFESVLHFHLGELGAQGFLAVPAKGPMGVRNGVSIKFARRAFGCRQGHHLKLGVPRQGGQKLLARHARGSNDGYFFLFHDFFPQKYRLRLGKRSESIAYLKGVSILRVAVITEGSVELR